MVECFYMQLHRTVHVQYSALKHVRYFLSFQAGQCAPRWGVPLVVAIVVYWQEFAVRMQ